MRLLGPLASLTLLLPAAAWAAPNVVVTTKPIHSLVASVMQGVGEPYLIVKGSASPHAYALRPSDAQALEDSDLVFWTGQGFELFLEGPLETLATSARAVELAKAPGITLLPMREGGAFEEHDHDHEEGDDDHDHDHDDHESHDDHAEGEWDMHFWLDPDNAKRLVIHIGDELRKVDPANAAIYSVNVANTQLSLDRLTKELEAQLEPVEDRPFIVFHDAYQYFEDRFDLDLVGTVTVSPEVAPGAARIDELKAKIAELGTACIFGEPNFRPTVINAIIEGTETRYGVLDPEASGLNEGPDLYAELLRGLSRSLVDCLD